MISGKVFVINTIQFAAQKFSPAGARSRPDILCFCLDEVGVFFPSRAKAFRADL